MSSLVVKFIIIVLALIVGIASYYFGPFKGKKDNIVEQMAEDIIQEETGTKVNLDDEMNDDSTKS